VHAEERNGKESLQRYVILQDGRSSTFGCGNGSGRFFYPIGGITMRKGFRLFLILGFTLGAALSVMGVGSSRAECSRDNRHSSG
jgi:hypothetical protein